MQPLPSVELLSAQLAARGIALPPGPVRLDGYGDWAELSTELFACPDLINSHTQIGGNHLDKRRDEIKTKSV